MLLIFIKNPILGKAKTRLAATVGNEEALKIYKALLEHTRKIALKIDTKRLLFYSDFIDENDEWSGNDFQKMLQISGDLGEKMADGFRQAFQQKAEKAVIVGSDCASLTAEIVEEAYRLLDHHDFVIGPAHDGGYYLLGMRTFEPSVFEGMEWSTAEVLTQTVEKIAALGKKYATLATLSDIDYEEDWIKYGWEV